MVITFPDIEEVNGTLLPNESFNLKIIKESGLVILVLFIKRISSLKVKVGFVFIATKSVFFIGLKTTVGAIKSLPVLEQPSNVKLSSLLFHAVPPPPWAKVILILKFELSFTLALLVKSNV